MIDFTSALYLNCKHSSAELAGWQQLTTGKPAALHEFVQGREIGQQVAKMQGLESGMCAPSTLHLYWDLFGFLRNQKITVFVDEKIYPVSAYGIERLLAFNIPVHTFRHLNANHLAIMVKTKLAPKTVPVVMTDGWCPPCGKAAPLKDYIAIISPYGGSIIIDDTQAFGIFGQRNNSNLYGTGGGGILQWLNAESSGIVTINSLAKAFGVPMAVVCGNNHFIETYARNSETRVNSSPVSAAHLSAALHALSINKISGDERRKKLLSNIMFIKSFFNGTGIDLQGGIFPVQSIQNYPYEATMHLYNTLNKHSIKTVLTAGHITSAPSVSFIIRCNHFFNEIEKIAMLISKSLSPGF